MEARHRGGAPRTRGALIALSAAVIVATAVPMALAATDDSASRGGPMLPANYVAEPVAESSTQAERLDSRTAFENASPTEAVAVAEQSFPELIGLLGAQPLPEAAEVIEYRGAFSAVLRDDAGPLLVQSMTPLRVAATSGVAPVDPTLEPAGNQFVPEASPTEISLPSDLDDGIEFGARDLGISLAGKEVGRAPQPLTGNRGLLYPEVATDLDLIAGVTASGGLELIAQVRSPESPEEATFPLDLPSGAELRSGADGGASVVAGGKAIAAITPPLAFDADHNVVPVKMAVDGDSLVLSISHRGEDVRYPVVADPAIFEAWDWSNPGSEGLQYFESFKSGGTNHEFAQVSDLSPYNGLWIKTHAGWYVKNTHGAWSFRVPHSNAYANAGPVDGAATSAYITQAWFSPYYHWGQPSGYPPDSDTSPLLVFCLANVLNDTCMSDSNGSGHASAFYQGQYNWASGETLTNVADYQQAERVTVDHVSDTDVYPNSYLAGERWTQVTGFAVAMNDGESPTVSATNAFASGGSLPTGWTNRSDDVVATIAGSDQGLGVQQLRLWLGCDDSRANCISSPPQWDMGSQTAGTTGPCIGGRTKVCPQGGSAATRTYAYSLGAIPEGIRYGYVQATDPLGKQSAQNQARWEFKIDRTQPSLSATGFGGNEASLSSQTNPLVGQNATVLVEATDALSGVTSVKFKIDGNVADEISEICPGGGCGISGSLAPDTTGVAPGPHTYSIVATDQAGNQRQVSGSFRLDPTPPTLAVSGSLVDADEAPLTAATASAAIEATDQAAGDTGVAKVAVLVDGNDDLANPAVCVPTCPASVSANYTYVSSVHGPGPHQVEIVATDAAGNKSERLLHIDVPAPPSAAACPSATPDSLPPSDVVSASVAQQSALASAVAASAATDDTVSESVLDPSLVASETNPSDPFDTIETLTNDKVASGAAGGFSLGNIACVEPGQTTSEETGTTIFNEDVGLNANSAPGTDTITRPTASGVMTIASRRTASSPNSLSWRIGVQSGYALQDLVGGGIAVIDPTRPSAGGSVPQRPPNAESATALNSAAVQVAEARYQIANAEQLTGSFVAAVIPRPYALSSSGSPSAATMSRSGETITVTPPAGSKALVVNAVRNEKASRAPAPARARYMNVRDRDDLLQQAGLMACNFAMDQGPAGERRQLMLFDFGAATRNNAGTQYGARLRGDAFFNNAEILQALKRAAESYSGFCHTTGRATLAYGTTNNTPDNSAGVLRELGRRQALHTQSLENWAQNRPLFPLPIDSAVAVDVEATWNSVGNTEVYVDQLKQSFSGPFINYGNACRTADSACDANGWSFADYARLTWEGDRSRAMPEIYETKHANIWRDIREEWNAGHPNEGFAGVTGSTNPVECDGGPNPALVLRPRASWSHLDEKTNGHVGRWLINIRDAHPGESGPFCD
jgi:hypothetical protein